MAKKLEIPCPLSRRGLPCELKLDYAMRGYAGILKGFLYAIREKYGAAAALEIYERVMKMDDRIKRLTKSILKIFKIEGNDCETIGQWFDIFWEHCGIEDIILERSKTINRPKITKCPWTTEPKDLRGWCITWCTIPAKTINPKATLERPKGMCAGDPYCEYVWKIEE